MLLATVSSALAGGEGNTFVYVTTHFTRLTCLLDVIMMYSFGRMCHRLEAPDFDVANHESNHEAGKLAFLMKHAIWILRIIQALPEFLLKRLSLAFESMVELKNVGSNPYPHLANFDF